MLAGSVQNASKLLAQFVSFDSPTAQAHDAHVATESGACAMTKYGTSAPAPKAAKSSDGSGERSGRITNGVAMGKADATGANKKFDTGKTAGVCYSHKRYSCQ